jgi:hypothetical protein
MRYVITAAVIGLLAVSSVSADGVPATTQPAANPDQDELSRPGAILVARWYALLDDNAATAVKALGTPKESDSKLYHAMLFKAAALRDAIAHANSRKEVLATGREVDFGKSQPGDNRMEIDPSFFIRLMARSPRRVTLEFDPSTPAVFDQFDPPDQDSVHIVLQHPDLKLTLTELPKKANSATQPSEQAIMYDGSLKAGEALAFFGTFTAASGTNYHHLVVWEAFRAEEWEASSFVGGASGIPTDWWIANGPQKMRMLADVAVVWASLAKHAPEDPPPAFSVILPNGAGVKLLALSRPARYSFCCWDAVGDPIDNPMHPGLSSFGTRDSGLHYTAEFHDSTSEANTPMPTGDDRPLDSQWWRPFSTAVPPSGQLTFILGEGPWKQIGELNSNQPLQVDNITYTIASKSGQGDDRFRVEYRRSVSSNELMALTAVSDEDSEIGSNAGSFVNDGTNKRLASATFSKLSLDHVKIFHLWLRKGHVVTFADFAQSPNERPPATVTHDQVVAAAAILRAAQPGSAQ